MLDRSCEREIEALAASRHGGVGGELAAHVASSPACAAALEVDAALGALATALRREATPRDAERILFRARLRELGAAAERATRPMTLWTRFAGLGTAAVVALGLASRAGDLWAWLRPAAGAASPSPMLAVLAMVGCGLAALLLWLYTDWAEG